ncbi:MAG: VWA domain-containing protein [Actinobacteria bacterium]|nr:VWA domain-containing protein [Actinomycetota bacterium]
MIDRLTAFVDRLRQVGVPVSTSEVIDASTALSFISWSERSVFRSALAATLIKNGTHRPVFETLFDIYFPQMVGELQQEPDSEQPSSKNDAKPLDDMTSEVLEALLRMDLELLDRLAEEAIARYAGMMPGRPVGGRYYQWKVEQALDMNAITERLTQMLGGSGPGGETAGSVLTALLAREDATARMGELRRRIERIIRGRLISDRGPEAMARALSRPLPEEVEFLQATSEDLAEMKRTIAAMSRRLAARLAYKHHRTKRGRIDFRKTIRRSLETGGTPLEPKYRHRTNRPDLIVMCDVSGSVASFSRFALSLLYALSQHFRKIRSFAFVDAIDEVTHFFEQAEMEEAARRVRTEANVVWLDGHSDYGHAFSQFLQRYGDALSPKTTVLVLGDARSNFRDPLAERLHEIRDRVRKLYFLNPEPHRHWDTGDSIVSKYSPVCDGVFEVRNLRQLAQFIERIG